MEKDLKIKKTKTAGKKYKTMLSISNKKSFTLIEMLLVIAILALLASIIFVSLGEARAKARDAKRKMDLRSIRTALEMYYDKYGHYPREPFDDDFHNFVRSTRDQPWIRDEPGGVGTGGGEGSLTEFIAEIPVDSINHNPDGPWHGEYSYAYATDAAGQEYDLVAQLENKNDPQTSQYQCWKVHVAPPSIWCSDSCDSCGGSHPAAPWGCDGCDYIYADH